MQHRILTAPVLFGTQFVTPIVTEYLLRYPEVSAVCLFLDRVINMLWRSNVCGRTRR